MTTAEPEIVSLLRFPPPVVTVLRWAGFVAALAAVALSWWANRIGWFEYRPGGTEFTVSIRPVVVGVFLAGALIALRFEMVGGVVAGFAAAALMAFAQRQLVAGHAVIVVLALAVPALLWIIVDLNTFDRRTAYFGLGAAVVAAIGGFALGQYVYQYFWGPTHPESTVVELPASDVEWAWSGAVTESTAQVRVKSVGDGDIGLVVWEHGSDEDGRSPISPLSREGAIATFALDGLQPGTTYRYAAVVDGDIDDGRGGRFDTFPDSAHSFRLAVGACARVGSNGAVFDAIAATDPLLYLIIGDMHYGDIPDDDQERFREVLDLTLTRPAQSSLYRSVPIAYVWDDHDYGFNDGDSNSAGRAAAMSVYRSYVPSYPLAGPQSSIHQSFTIGRVRVIMTDARSERIPGETMLGDQQKAWLLDELETSSQDHALVIWVNPVPWIAESGEDTWAGYGQERAEIAEFIADNNIENLLMVSGDAHMAAFDDGTNTNYSSQPGPAFPLVHAAALDRPGSFKGGPYSDEVSEGGGQFGLLDIRDDGNSVTVSVEGRSWDGGTIFSHEFVPRLPSGLSG